MLVLIQTAFRKLVSSVNVSTYPKHTMSNICLNFQKDFSLFKKWKKFSFLLNFVRHCPCFPFVDAFISRQWSDFPSDSTKTDWVLVWTWKQNLNITNARPWHLFLCRGWKQKTFFAALELYVWTQQSFPVTVIWNLWTASCNRIWNVPVQMPALATFPPSYFSREFKWNGFFESEVDLHWEHEPQGQSWNINVSNAGTFPLFQIYFILFFSAWVFGQSGVALGTRTTNHGTSKYQMRHLSLSHLSRDLFFA